MFDQLLPKVNQKQNHLVDNPTIKGFRLDETKTQISQSIFFFWLILLIN
jgi:hypothetical protein